MFDKIITKQPAIFYSQKKIFIIVLCSAMASILGCLLVFFPFLTSAVFIALFISLIVMSNPKNLLWVAIAFTPFANVVILDIAGIHIRFVQFFWFLFLLVSVFKSALLKKINLRLPLIFWSLLLYNLFNFISITQSVEVKRSIIDSFQFLGLSVIFILLVNHLKETEDIFFAVKIIILTGSVFILSGLFQYIAGFSPIPQVILGNYGISISFQPKFLKYISLHGVYIRTNSLYYGVVATGCYSAQLSLLLFLGKRAFASQKKFFVIIFLMIPFSIFLLLATYSRSAILAFIITVLTTGLYVKKYRNYNFFISIVFVALLAGSSVYERLTTSFNLHESTNPQHLIIYLKAIELFLARPWTGWGCGTAATLIGTGSYVQLYGLKAFIGEKAAVHNWFLQTAAESGIFALTSISIFVVTFLMRAHKILKKTDIDPILLGLISATFCGLTVIQISNFFIREAFWVLMGITWAAINLYSVSDVKNRGNFYG